MHETFQMRHFKWQHCVIISSIWIMHYVATCFRNVFIKTCLTVYASTSLALRVTSCYYDDVCRPNIMQILWPMNLLMILRLFRLPTVTVYTVHRDPGDSSACRDCSHHLCRSLSKHSKYIKFHIISLMFAASVYHLRRRWLVECCYTVSQKLPTL